MCNLVSVDLHKLAEYLTYLLYAFSMPTVHVDVYLVP